MKASQSIEVRRERVAASPRWDGERFRNTHATPRGTEPMPSMKDFLCGGDRRVPAGPLPAMNPRDTWRAPPQSGLRATWLGHSTVLVEIDGWRVLTDPVWGPRASPTRFVGPKRFQPVPVPMSDLPKLDAVLVSHDHYDHLDFTTMRLLRRVNVPIITSLGVGAHLESFGIAPERIVELDWWESHRVPNTDLTFTATPSRRSTPRRANAPVHSISSCSKSAHSIPRGAESISARGMHWRRTRCWAAARSCRFTGARSISRCIPGTIPSRS
jgi:hypothetical protein